MKYFCHICAKENAKTSMSFPDVVVCNCSGKWEEVGSVKDGKFTSLNPATAQTKSSASSSADFDAVVQFNYLRVDVKIPENLKKIGTGMVNACQNDPDKYLSMGTIHMFLHKDLNINTLADLDILQNNPQDPRWSRVHLALISPQKKIIHLLSYKNQNLPASEEKEILAYLRGLSIIN